MASKFYQICEAFTQYFSEQEGETIVKLPKEEGWDLTREGYADILVRLSEQALHTQSAPPRFVLVPRDAQFTYVDRHGGQKKPEQSVAVRGIRRRLFRIQTYCWGRDFDEAEAMLENAIRAYEMFHNAVDFSDEVWETEQPGASGPVTEGKLISFFAIFDVEVTTKPQPMRRMTSAEITVQELDTKVVITL